MSEAEIARTVEDLRLWAVEAVGEKALRADWHATLRRFLRRDAEARRTRPARSASVAPAGLAQTIHIKRDSPQGEAWWSFVKTKTGRTPPLDKAGGWRFPSEWPPRENGAAQSAI